MNLGDVMDAVGSALETIEGLRVQPYWADRVTPPAATVGLPEAIDYDAAFRRGGDRVELTVTLLVSRNDARSARDALAVYADGAGTSSVKRAIEAHVTTAYDSARVTRAEFAATSVAGVDYLAGTFSVDIIGTGA